MNGRDDTTTFLPLDFRIGGQNRDSCPTVGQYLTRDQSRYVYKKVERGEMINTDKIQQEIEQEKLLNKMDDRNREINPYRNKPYSQQCRKNRTTNVVVCCVQLLVLKVGPSAEEVASMLTDVDVKMVSLTRRGNQLLCF